MKKILIFVLAAVLSLAMFFSVTACGDSEVVDPVTVTISQETASVEVGSTVTLTATTSYEVPLTDENTSVKMVGQWQYWSEIANDAALTDTVTDCAYDNGSVSFTMDQTNAVNWYATQFFYDVFGIENKQNYTVTMKITVTDLTLFDGAEAGKITVNGTEYTLVEGENDIEVTRAYNTNKAAVSVQMGVNGDTPLTVKSGAFVISDITIA